MFDPVARWRSPQCNSRLERLVAQYESEWRRPLAGILHLAGLYGESLVVDESREQFERLLRPKTLGTWTLHRLLDRRGGGVFISTSSVAIRWIDFTGGS